MFNCTTVAVHRQDKALRNSFLIYLKTTMAIQTDQVSLNKTRNAEDKTVLRKFCVALFVHAHNFRVTLWMRTP